MRWCPIKLGSICRVDSVGLLPGKALIPHYVGSFSKGKNSVGLLPGKALIPPPHW